jgi:thiol-disulfide isomerase/thioredoxin
MASLTVSSITVPRHAKCGAVTPSGQVRLNDMSWKPATLAAAAYLMTVAGGALAGGVIPTQSPEKPLPAPALVVKTLDGKNLALNDLRGKVVLINFWATWCSPCRAEIPSLVDLQARYRDHLSIVGLSLDDGPVDAVKNFASALRMNYPIAIVGEDVAHTFGEMIGLPTTLLIDRTGRIVSRHTGLISPASLEREVRALAGVR